METSSCLVRDSPPAQLLRQTRDRRGFGFHTCEPLSNSADARFAAD